MDMRHGCQDAELAPPCLSELTAWWDLLLAVFREMLQGIKKKKGREIWSVKHIRSTVLLWRRRKWVISQGIWGWGDSRFLEQLSIDSKWRKGNHGSTQGHAFCQHLYGAWEPIYLQNLQVRGLSDYHLDFSLVDPEQRTRLNQQALRTELWNQRWDFQERETA